MINPSLTFTHTHYPDGQYDVKVPLHLSNSSATKPSNSSHFCAAKSRACPVNHLGFGDSSVLLLLCYNFRRQLPLLCPSQVKDIIVDDGAEPLELP